MSHSCQLCDMGQGTPILGQTRQAPPVLLPTRGTQNSKDSLGFPLLFFVLPPANRCEHHDEGKIAIYKVSLKRVYNKNCISSCFAQAPILVPSLG